MAKKNQPGKGTQLARAYLLSYPQLFMFAIIFALAGGLTVWTGWAAPHNGGGKPGGGTISLKMVTDKNGDGLPNWGDTVTFSVTDKDSFPSVQLACYQGNTLVFDQAAGFYPTYMWSNNFTLSDSSRWTSGAADCTAVLYHAAKNGTYVTDATLNFHVNP